MKTTKAISVQVSVPSPGPRTQKDFTFRVRLMLSRLNKLGKITGFSWSRRAFSDAVGTLVAINTSLTFGSLKN